jgi:hypothetical protein
MLNSYGIVTSFRNLYTNGTSDIMAEQYRLGVLSVATKGRQTTPTYGDEMEICVPMVALMSPERFGAMQNGIGKLFGFRVVKQEHELRRRRCLPIWRFGCSRNIVLHSWTFHGWESSRITNSLDDNLLRENQMTAKQAGLDVGHTLINIRRVGHCPVICSQETGM